jgi:hypothetical protein
LPFAASKSKYDVIVCAFKQINAQNIENFKNLLTRARKRGIICKSPQEGEEKEEIKRDSKRRASEKNSKKSQKTFQKGIDKPSRVWYNSQAVRESGWHGH